MSETYSVNPDPFKKSAGSSVMAASVAVVLAGALSVFVLVL
jgi:hypothetical protein